jgi:hypothetical protein
MEVIHVFIQPTIAGQIINYYRLDMETAARNALLIRRLWRRPRPVKIKVPDRVPRSWRRKYLLADYDV